MKNISSGKLFAVKTHITREPEAIETIRREYLRIRALSHANILQYHELYIDTNEGKVYLVMEYFNGSNLSNVVSVCGGLPEPALQDIAQQLFSVVAYLHVQGVVHRDIKPDNILIKKSHKSGRYKLALIDFGVAAFNTPRALTVSSNSYTMSDRTGTLAYRAPETFNEIEYSESVDAWALGCTLYEAAFGERFMRHSSARTLTSTKPQLLPSLGASEKLSACSASLAHLLIRLLETDARKRSTVMQAMRHGWLHCDTPGSSESLFCAKRYSCVNILLTQIDDVTSISGGRCRIKSFS